MALPQGPVGTQLVLESVSLRREGEKYAQANKRCGATAHSGALGPGVGLGESLLVWGAGWAPSGALCSLPSYLYPDGKNHNPDLTELCHMEPHQLIYVSEVKLRPVPRSPRPPPPPPPHTHAWLRNSLSPSQAWDPRGLGASCWCDGHGARGT